LDTDETETVVASVRSDERIELPETEVTFEGDSVVLPISDMVVSSTLGSGVLFESTSDDADSLLSSGLLVVWMKDEEVS